MSFELLKNSFLLASGSTLLAGALGFSVAIWTAGLKKVLQRLVSAAAVRSMALPECLQANCWLELLGNNGAWKNWLPLTIYSFPGAVWLLTLALWPISFAFALAALQGIDRSHFDLEPRLRGILLVRHLLWPASNRGLLHAAILTFVLALNNFAVPALLQVRVLPAQVWIQFETNLNVMSALLRSLPLIVAPLVLLCLWRNPLPAWSGERKDSAPAFRRQLGTKWMICLGTLSFLLLVCSTGLPLWQLLGQERTWNQLSTAWSAASPVVWNTLFVAVMASSTSMLLGLLIARMRAGRLLWLLFFTPGVLLGIVLVTVFNRDALDFIYRSLSIVIIAWTIRYCAVGWHTVRLAFLGVDKAKEETARLLGASRWQLMRYVEAPGNWPKLAVGWYLI